MGLSARRLGEKIGLTAEQTNTLLKESGFQKGNPGEYSVTDKGREYLADEKSWCNGYGGWATRGYDYNEWDESIINELDTSSENLERIRDLTSKRRRERKNNTRNTQYNEKNDYNDYDYDYDNKTDYSNNNSINETDDNIAAGVGLIVAAGLFIYGVVKGIYEKRKHKRKK